ncbi:MULTISPECIES: hypothetical protein [unclassified Pantoea]|jgi:hypothetical protein|uniref:hypothetical protein n=1 Tax=unclassified Pantoea TaxID=2630326 RepID=UPI0023DAB3EF|nr:MULTISPECIES: hypothetical protein [unclassified Pantoea]MDF2043821.1 hypothetical protein [Pantoea sp. Cr_R14]MDF2069820.1 hypothetical protein [Pantoea sp. Cr_R13]MDF2081423.1 hypothetical protein [Pantoea sp. Cr_R21]
MFVVPESYSTESINEYYEVIDAVTLNGARCMILWDGKASRAAVVQEEASEEDGEMRQNVLAVLELERVTRINTVLRVLSFGADPDGLQLNDGFVEPVCLAKALYEALTIKKRLTLVGS